MSRNSLDLADKRPGPAFLPAVMFLGGPTGSRPSPSTPRCWPSGRWYEEGKISNTLAGWMVRSKSEVIIANMLHERGVPLRYEVQVFAPDGIFCLPDFTITWNGEQWFWDHGLFSALISASESN